LEVLVDMRRMPRGFGSEKSVRERTSASRADGVSVVMTPSAASVMG